MINKDFLIGYAAGQANAGESGGDSLPVICQEIMVINNSQHTLDIKAYDFLQGTGIQYFAFGSSVVIRPRESKIIKITGKPYVSNLSAGWIEIYEDGGAGAISPLKDSIRIGYTYDGTTFEGADATIASIWNAHLGIYVSNKILAYIAPSNDNANILITDIEG